MLGVGVYWCYCCWAGWRSDRAIGWGCEVSDMSTEKALNSNGGVENSDTMSHSGDWAGNYPDPEGRTCDVCHSILVIDCAGLTCDYCWRVADGGDAGDAQ